MGAQAFEVNLPIDQTTEKHLDTNWLYLIGVTL
jgi:hypothetical protein